MTWRVRYAPAARHDLKRLYGFLLEQDIVAARRALASLVKSIELLQELPFTCRKVEPDNPLLRELLVSFRHAGYILLYEIDDDQTVTIIAVRHQREDDYL